MKKHIIELIISYDHPLLTAKILYNQQISNKQKKFLKPFTLYKRYTNDTQRAKDKRTIIEVRTSNNLTKTRKIYYIKDFFLLFTFCFVLLHRELKN